MSTERAASEPTYGAPQARAARTREQVRSRVARARIAIIAGITATTCGLAVLIQSIAPGSATASAHTSASATPGSAQQLLGGGGPGDDGGGGFPGDGHWSGSGGTAPSASSGQGDAVSGGS